MIQTQKKLKVDIFENDIDGNVFEVIVAFVKQARREGWTEEERNEVLKEAQRGDYNHVIQTIMGVTE